MSAEAEKIFLAGIFPGHRERLLKVSVTVPPEVLMDPHLRALYHFTVLFLDHYGDMPNPATVKLHLETTYDAGEGANIWVAYAAAVGTSVPEADFLYAAQILTDAAEKRMTGEALGIAFEIFDSGYNIGTETLQGHRAAQEYLASRLPEIRRTGLLEGAGEGDVRSEVQAIWDEYERKENAGELPGIEFGLPTLDNGTGGMHRGDLILVAAYTSHGKSQICTSMGWDASVRQGKNVFYATSETSREDIRNRYLARHSRLPKFGLPDGLDHNKIRRSVLSASEKAVLQQVLLDLANPNNGYGTFHIAQIPRGSTLTYLEMRALAKHREWGVDLLIDDYLNLLKPERARTSQREEASDILKDAKVLATSFGTHGVPVVSPWQISRMAYQKAQAQQMYDLDALSEASEAEKSADLILGLWHNSLLDPRRTSVQVMKNRNGAPIKKIDCAVDYRNAFFAETGDIAAAYAKPGGVTTAGGAL